MEDISLHILDIVENSIRAEAKNVSIRIMEDQKKDIFELEIRDNGRGMGKELLEKVMDPFTTTKKAKKVGLGLALLEEAARAACGSVNVESKEGSGTAIKAQFQLSHIDRKPLGNIDETLLCLMTTCQDVTLVYEHIRDGKTCRLDTALLRAKAGAIPLHSPEGIHFLKEQIKQCFERIDVKINR